MYVWLATNGYFSWHKIQVDSCISQNDFRISQYVNISFITGNGKKTFFFKFLERHFPSDNKNIVSYAFDSSFFFYCGLSSVRRLGNNENRKGPKLCLVDPAVVSPSHHSSAARGSVGPCTGASPPFDRFPRSDLYDTGDVCEFDANEYIYVFISHILKEPGSLDGEDCGFSHMWGLL